jgi:uncharacterized protein (TIGR00369 family)
MTLELPVTDGVRQPFGLLHGGVHAAIAETLAVDGTVALIGAGGGAEPAVRGLSTQTSFLRPLTRGAVHAVARPRHRGRTTWVWEVELRDDDEKLCCLVRTTVGVG